MLKILDIKCSYCVLENGDSAITSIQFTIKAPIYWWLDTDYTKYFLNMPTDNIEFCYDAWPNETPLVSANLAVYENSDLTVRQKMQMLPMATLLTAMIELSYAEIVEICENYISGEYLYHKGYGFPNEEEWAYFCETLLTIKGVRDLIKEEI